MEHCREETIHPVTIEIAESWRDGTPQFQARARFDTMVIQPIGPPKDTELEAFDEITRVIAGAAEPRTRRPATASA